MSPTDAAVQEQQASARKHRVVNDFSIQVATVNGSGSQTANLVLLRSILLMGVPVSGKNMFPSNIAGLPTFCWGTILFPLVSVGYLAYAVKVASQVVPRAPEVLLTEATEPTEPTEGPQFP